MRWSQLRPSWHQLRWLFGNMLMTHAHNIACSQYDSWPWVIERRRCNLSTEQFLRSYANRQRKGWRSIVMNTSLCLSANISAEPNVRHLRRQIVVRSPSSECYNNILILDESIRFAKLDKGTLYRHIVRRRTLIINFDLSHDAQRDRAIHRETTWRAEKTIR